MRGTLRLGDHCLKIGSGATPRGGKDAYLAQGPYSLIRSQNVLNERFSIGGLAFISQEQADQLSNVEVQSSDVLLNITGDSVARVCQVDPMVLPARVNQHVAIIRPKPEVIDPRFLRYFMVSPEMQAHMLGLAASGATRNALTKGMIEKFEIPAVPLPEQRAIAATLGALDDKIELNRKMNATLEAMGRALFRDWFVDFGPTRAKMEGRVPYLSPDLWSLFPARLDDEGKPEGWEEKPLDEIADFLNGLALQKFPAEQGTDSLAVIKIAELRNGITANSNRASRTVPPQYVVQDGDFLFSWSGSLLAKFWTGGEGALNQHLFKVASQRYPAWFFSKWVQHHLADFQVIAASKATTMGHIQRGHLKAAMTICPPDRTIATLGEVVAPLIDRIVRNELESRTLAQTRDLLLPRLMSGEIRIRDTERLVEEAG